MPIPARASVGVHRVSLVGNGGGVVGGFGGAGQQASRDGSIRRHFGLRRPDLGGGDDRANDWVVLAPALDGDRGSRFEV